LAIYGGFAGTETELAERDWSANPAILDGGNAASPLRNVDLNATVSSLLDGVVVQNALSPSDANGGGMIITNGAIIRNCIFRNNQTQNAKNGAAIHCHMGSMTIENCLFTGNTSSGNGGAIQIGGNVTATVSNCTFVDNQSVKPGGAFGLGNNTSNLTLNNTVAWNNLSGTNGYNSYGQNDNLNNGGTVISNHSAIESASTKFTDGDDVAHITLSQIVTPGLSNSGQPTKGSLCIDAGDSDAARHLSLDLDGGNRIQGESVDIGAYEYSDASTFPLSPSTNELQVVYQNGFLYIYGATGCGNLTIYDTAGKPVFQSKLADNTQKADLSAGIYVVKLTANGKTQITKVSVTN
jgi:predicted outer membrane repeat protein